MRIISIDRLGGIPREHIPVLFQAMTGCSNPQRLAVALYFMSALPDGRHRLQDIERAVVTIFPPSVRQKKLPHDYVDFAAAALRSIFNAETAAVQGGVLEDDFRYWRRVMRGHWRNTELGNKYALQVLRERRILVQRGDRIENSSDQQLPEVKRTYLDEENSEPVVIETALQAAEDAESDNLLAYADRVIEGLPPLSVQEMGQDTLTSVEIKGTPDEVRAMLLRIIDVHTPAICTITVRIDGSGMTVSVRTNS